MHEHGHTHDHQHQDGQAQTHAHPHEHEHAHAHTHEDGQEHTHAHEHEHAHEHAHDHGADHTHADGSHDGLLKSSSEAAAFLRYTLQHNAHHEEELSGLVHSLRHLGKDKDADEIASCIDALQKVNARLETIFDGLK
jgi:hypothetical protein